MRTITKIAKQRRSSERYNIFLNGQYAFSVSKGILIKYPLHKGLQLSEKDVADLVEVDSIHRSYLLAINYLSYRMRTVHEIRTYLQKNEKDEDIVNQIIDRLEKEGLINDADFANAFVRDRISRTSKGPFLIVKELREKGVSSDVAEEAIKQYSNDEQFTTALKWTQKEKNKRSKLSYAKRNNQLKYKLMQKGFSSDIAEAVVQEISLEKNEDEEYENVKFFADKLYNKYQKKYSGNELIMKVKVGLYRRGFQSDLIYEYVDKLQD